MLNFKLTNEDNRALIELKGELDIATVEAFKQNVELAQTGAKLLNIDCGELSFVDSTGVGAILKVIKTLKHNNKEVKLSNIAADVYEVFDLLGLPMLLGAEIFECRVQS